MNVAIACGGTGGHLFPGLAVGEVLIQRGHKVLLLISEKKIDATAVRDRVEFDVEKIPAVGLPRLFSPQIVSFASRFLNGLRACQRIYQSFKPDAVLGMGGFTSTPPILAGRLARLPTYIHESNAIPGKANRLNARLSNKVLLGFEECSKYFPQSRIEVVGTPIRSSLLAPVDRQVTQQRLKLKEGLQTVLIMGGSQGAHGINEAVIATLPQFASKPVQFIHLTGPDDENYVFESYKKEGIPAFVGAFYHRMEQLYRFADLAVARSGAASLTELSYFGLPSILIPYPFAAENHQYLNAEIFAKSGAAEVIEESRVNRDTLGSLISELLVDSARRKQMSERLRALAPESAANRIAQLMEET